MTAQADFDRDTAILVDAGIAMPAEITALRQRLTDFASISGHPCRDRLVAALAAGDTDITELRAAALAETENSTHQLVTAVAAEIHQLVTAAYARVAEANYDALAQRFDTEAAAFSKSSTAVDPETPANQMVAAPAKERQAWLDAELRASTMTNLLPALAAAARLAGVDVRDRDALALTVNPGTLHRRRVWEAWNSHGERCGRWSALHTLGATLRACPLHDYEPYAEPLPLETRQERVKAPYVGIRQVVVDPHDAEYASA